MLSESHTKTFAVAFHDSETEERRQYAESETDTLYCRVSGYTQKGESVEILVMCQRVRHTIYNLCHSAMGVRMTSSQSVTEQGMVWVKKKVVHVRKKTEESDEEKKKALPQSIVYGPFDQTRQKLKDVCAALRTFPEPGSQLWKPFVPPASVTETLQDWQAKPFADSDEDS